jgi:hypothetical protein
MTDKTRRRFLIIALIAFAVAAVLAGYLAGVLLRAWLYGRVWEWMQ